MHYILLMIISSKLFCLLNLEAIFKQEIYKMKGQDYILVHYLKILHMVYQKIIYKSNLHEVQQKKKELILVML